MFVFFLAKPSLEVFMKLFYVILSDETLLEEFALKQFYFLIILKRQLALETFSLNDDYFELKWGSLLLGTVGIYFLRTAI